MKNSASPPLLTTDKIILQPYAQCHDQQTVLWLNDQEIRETFGITKSIDVHSHRKWIEAQDNLLIWAITLPENGHIGNATLRINMSHRSGYYEMYLGVKRCRSRGFGWKVLSTLLNYAFTELSLHRITLFTLPDNNHAERLYKKAGFSLEGIQRQAIYRGGNFEDQKCWSLLHPEWKNGL